MRKFVLVALVAVGLICGAGSAKAQAQSDAQNTIGNNSQTALSNGGATSGDPSTNKFEFATGYSFLHVSTDGHGYNYNGGDGSLAWNATPWLAIVGDLSGYYYSQHELSSNITSYMFGPKFSMHRGAFTPFAQGMLGGVHFSDKECSPGTSTGGGGPVQQNCSSNTENSIGLTLGGGLDWQVTPHFGVRPIEFDYVLSHVNFQVENNVRLMFGVTASW